MPTGKKLWLWRYQFNGTEKNITFGEYPVVGPKDARELHYAAKKLLATGINPMAKRKAEAEAKEQEVQVLERDADSSFENISRQWWTWCSIGESPRHADTLMKRLEADVFPVIGHLQIDSIQARHIRDIMLTVEKRGASDIAKRAHQSVGQIFRFAIARDLASLNPSADFRPRDILAAAKNENFARVDEKDLPELLAKMAFADGLVLQDIYGARRQKRHSRKRDERLDHHQNLGPSRQNRRVSWRECGAGVESEKQIVHKIRAPVLLTHRQLGLLIEGHLRKQERAIGMHSTQLASARATCIHPPVPRREDEDVRDPQGCSRAQQVLRGFSMRGQGNNEQIK